MRGSKRLGVVIACVCMLGAINVSAAWASKALELEVGKTPVATGSAGYTGVLIGGCTIFANGTVTVNGASKDKLTATSNAFDECTFPKTLTGTFTETVIGDNHKVALIGTLTYTEPGPCVYTFNKFKTTFTGPEAVFEGSTKGKLKKEGSAKTCAKTLTEHYEGDLINEVGGEAAFEAVVTG